MKAEYLDHMGDDLAVVQAAKVSFESDASEWVSDELAELLKEAGQNVRSHPRLIRYLAKHDHFTPFAHTAIKLRMKAPVPIRTQCFKHKVGFVENEESRRYISSRPQLFVPYRFRSKPEGSIKQGSAGEHPTSYYWEVRYKEEATRAINTYMDMVHDGVCPEQARLVLPQGVEVNWIWTGNLYSYANFYKKRTDSHAQVEVQQLAKEVGKIVEGLFPVSWKALVE